MVYDAASASTHIVTDGAMALLRIVAARPASADEAARQLAALTGDAEGEPVSAVEAVLLEFRRLGIVAAHSG